MFKPTTNTTASGSKTKHIININHLTTFLSSTSNASAINLKLPISVSLTCVLISIIDCWFVLIFEYSLFISSVRSGCFSVLSRNVSILALNLSYSTFNFSSISIIELFIDSRSTTCDSFNSLNLLSFELNNPPDSASIFATAASSSFNRARKLSCRVLWSLT